MAQLYYDRCLQGIHAKKITRREHMRKYNSAMAFASIGAEIKSPSGNNPYCFRIYGRIYHLVSPLYPNEVNKPEYGQLHIFDSTEATTKRLENQSNQRGMAEAMRGYFRINFSKHGGFLCLDYSSTPFSQ
jgi:hypothetical protein